MYSQGINILLQFSVSIDIGSTWREWDDSLPARLKFLMRISAYFIFSVALINSSELKRINSLSAILCSIKAFLILLASLVSTPFSLTSELISARIFSTRLCTVPNKCQVHQLKWLWPSLKSHKCLTVITLIGIYMDQSKSVIDCI